MTCRPTIGVAADEMMVFGLATISDMNAAWRRTGGHGALGSDTGRQQSVSDQFLVMMRGKPAP